MSEKSVRRATMIARDQRALLRRVANIYPGPGGGMDPGPGGGGYAGPGGGKYPGPSRYADGGGVKPFPRSKDPKAPINYGYDRHTSDVPVEWLSRMPGNARRLKDEEYAELKRQLQTEGIRNPLTILVGKRSRTAKLGEGNHRLMIARELGYTHVPARVLVGEKYGSEHGAQADYNHDLIPEPDKYFSEDAKPSAVFKSLQAPEPRASGGKVPPFKLYSGAAKLIAQKGQAKATPQQYAALPGVKPDELKYAKFDTLGNKAVPKEQVLEHLEGNTVPLQETVYTGKDERSALSRYSTPSQSIALPGGQNYREILLHTPVAPHTPSPKLADARKRMEAATNAYDAALLDQLSGNPRFSDDEYRRASDEADASRIAYNRLAELDKREEKNAGFQSSHWEDVPNVVAHIRMHDRKGPNGEKVLHVEEVQSDWGQQGRDEGFRATPEEEADIKRRYETDPTGTVDEYNRRINDARIPRGPYVDNTQKWTDLALKRVLHEAAHGGYDKVVFTPGDEQNKRYSLEKHVKEIEHIKRGNQYQLGIVGKNGEGVELPKDTFTAEELPSVVGKEIAEKIVNGEGKKYRGHEGYTLEGLDLKVGGSGMRGYYDNIMPKRLQALAQQHDPKAKVQLGGHRLPPKKKLEGYETEPGDVLEHMGVPPLDWSVRWPAMSDEEKAQAHAAYENSGPALHSLDVTPQMRDSIKQNGFSQFRRGGDVGMRHRYADGGGADNPVVGKALDLVSMFQSGYPSAAPAAAPSPMRNAPTLPGTMSVKSLSDAFQTAIAHHTSLPPEQRAANSRAAAEKLATYMGKTKSGMHPPLLTKNAKLLKSEAGYKGGQPITLPDGRGVETTGLALAPAYQEGKFTTCPNSASCKAECLGKFSGGYYFAGGGKDPDALKGPRLNSVRKTVAMLREPEAFAVRLHDEIAAAHRMAEMNNNMLGVRLNVLSDINPRVHKPIFDAHPDVAFYDYTKNNTNPVAPNHHYTYSSTGVSDDDVHNPHSNWKQMRKRLDDGFNVAMAFSHHGQVPETVHDEETGKTYKVVPGDSHDFRPMDIQPRGASGVIVGLRNKKANSDNATAHKTSNGFFVRYDPQYLKGNRGTQVKGPDGKPIPQNTQARIKAQHAAPTLKTNDEAESP